MEIDKNNLQNTCAFRRFFKKVTVELTGEVSLIRSGAEFLPAGKCLQKIRETRNVFKTDKSLK